MNRITHSWLQFWFEPSVSVNLLPLRVALCAVIAIWFASFWPGVEIWFGAQGVLSTELAAKLVAFEEIARWECWSPLWWTDQQVWYYAWILGGILLAILSGVGLGGRLTLSLLVVWMIAWAHRIVWLTGIVEPAIIAFAAYLIVEPGPSLRLWPKATKRLSTTGWQATIATRLIQTHWWILLAASLLSQLAGIAWWRGEAVWWLVAAGRSTAISVESLRDSPSLVNGLTHGFVAIEMLALWLVTTQGGRLLGLAFGWLSCLAIAFVADQLLYGLLLSCGLMAFVKWPIRSTQ